MRYFYILLVGIMAVCTACGQHLREICTLPSVLAENSGMVVSTANRIWLHNDGGNPAKLYLIDTTGVIQKEITIQNATNIDWEDMTTDHQGNLYLGDIGNNNNSRQNLKIYKLPHPDSVQGTVVNATIIHYSYEDQTQFPPANSNQKYDAEAMIYYQDSLYIFTKDRTNPHLGYTWLYQLPADTGTHVAILMDSFHTQQMSFVFEITAAAISNQQLALLGAGHVWLFKNIIGNQFFNGTLEHITLNSFSQREAMDFVTNNRLYISNESSILGTAKLMELQLNSIVNNLNVKQSSIVEEVSIYPNPAQETYAVAFSLEEEATVSINLYSSAGKLVYRYLKQKKLNAGKQQIELSVDPNWAKGTYFLQVKTKHSTCKKRFLITN